MIGLLDSSQRFKKAREFFVNFGKPQPKKCPHCNKEIKEKGYEKWQRRY